MFWRYCAMLFLIGSVAGCDDATVSGTERRVILGALNLSDLQDDNGLLVEVHGAPWPGATPDQIASTMRMPKGKAGDVRFRSIPHGQWRIGNGNRLVLHFNPVGAPDSNADCRTETEIETKPPRTKGFTVNATLCRQDQWLIRGFLTAKAVKQNDWFEYTVVMRKLLGTLFPD
jgi:hypothetical protein